MVMMRLRPINRNGNQAERQSSSLQLLKLGLLSCHRPAGRANEVLRHAADHLE
jgi:hypothetical protein